MQVEFSDGERNYAWKASQLISAGWKAIGPSLKQKEDEENEELTLSRLPSLSQDDELPMYEIYITFQKVLDIF